MSDALYERYKDALRRGHVAALRNRHDLAVEAYVEASQLAPDRALPFVSIGAVLVLLGRQTEALSAFDAAIERAPTDETALRGRADCLVTLGDPSAAALTLDRLTGHLQAAERWPEATMAASRALELAESRDRRATVGALVTRLRAASTDDPAVVEAIERATWVLDPPAAEPVVPPPPPFDPVAAVIEVEAAVASGDPERIRTVALAAAAGHRSVDQPSAAIDACFVALGATPGDPALHLALANLYLDRGWRGPATEKLLLLARLVELTDDADARTALCRVVSTRLPDEPRLSAVCA
jgi:tetratricopeptide (TPR) repeat protein